MKKISDLSGEDISVIIFVGLGLIGSCIGLLAQYNRDLFYISLFLIVILFILFLLKVKKKLSRSIKLFWLLLAAFIFTHFIIFPLWYVSILKKDLHSITINQEILSSEKEYAIEELVDQYKPEKLTFNAVILAKVLRDTNSILDTSISYLKNNNIIVLDSFVIVRIDSIIEQGGRQPRPQLVYDCILISNKKGLKLAKLFEKKATKMSDKNISIRKYFTLLEEFYNAEINTYSINRKDAFTGKGIWTYTRILPYSLNIFNADNLKPISSYANIVHFIHYIITWMLILPMLGSFLYGFFLTKRNLK